MNLRSIRYELIIRTTSNSNDCIQMKCLPPFRQKRLPAFKRISPLVLLLEVLN